MSPHENCNNIVYSSIVKWDNIKNTRIKSSKLTKKVVNVYQIRPITVWFHIILIIWYIINL
jgi:hypothetical protein